VGADFPSAKASTVSAPADRESTSVASAVSSETNTPRTGRRDMNHRRRIEVRLTAEVACAG
jgi:hypothetical protein